MFHNNILKAVSIIVLFLSILAAGIWLRLNAAVNQSFWQDEVFIFTTARDNSPADILLMNLHDKAHPQLYYLFIHYWQKIDTSIFFLRFPSIVAGVLTIPLVFFIGRSVYGKKFGLVSSLIFSIHPFFVSLGFQAKFYPFVFLFVFAGYSCFLKTMDTNKKVWIILSAVFNALAFYTDYSAFWYFAAVIIGLFVSRFTRKNVYSSVLPSFLRISILTLLLVSFGAIPLTVDLPDILRAESFLGEKRLVNVDITLRKFLGFYGYSNYITTYIFFYLFVYSIWNLTKAELDNKKHFFLLSILVGAIAPLAIIYVMSQWIPAFNDRNLWFSGLIVPFGFAAFFVSIKQHKSWQTPIILLSFVYLVIIFTTSLYRKNYFSGKTDWKSVIETAHQYQNQQKIFLFLDYEDPYWGRLRPLREYYLPGYDHPESVTNYRIVTIAIQDGLNGANQEEISRYSGNQAVWLLYSGEFLDPWSLNQDEKEDHLDNIKTAQRLLGCQGKPCENPVIIYD